MCGNPRPVAAVPVSSAVIAFAILLPFSNYRIVAEPAMSVEATLDLYVTPVLHISDIAVLALLIAGAASIRRNVFVSPGRAWLACVLGPGILALATAPFAAHAPALAGYFAVRWILAAAVFISLIQLAPHARLFTAVFLASLVAHVGVGVAQVIAQAPLGLPLELALPAHQTGAAIVSVGERNWLRAYGLTFHPNVLGGFLVAGILLGLPHLRLIAMRFVWWLLWVGLLLTFSRSAILSAIIVVPLAGLLLARLQPDLRRAFTIAGAGVLLVAIIGSLLFHEQITTRLSLSRAAEIFSLEERGEQIDVAATLVSAHPITGVGAGNFSLAVAGSGVSTRPLPVHNVTLLLASEVGIAGGLVWLAILAMVVGAIVRVTKRQLPESIPPLCAALALWVIGLFDYYPWGLNAGRLLFVTMLALGVAGRSQVSRAP